MTKYKITSVFRETYETFVEAKDEDEAWEIHYSESIDSDPIWSDFIDEDIEEVKEEVAA